MRNDLHTSTVDAAASFAQAGCDASDDRRADIDLDPFERPAAPDHRSWQRRLIDELPERGGDPWVEWPPEQLLLARRLAADYDDWCDRQRAAVREGRR
jgi:hypothetical protein